MINFESILQRQDCSRFNNVNCAEIAVLPDLLGKKKTLSLKFKYDPFMKKGPRISRQISALVYPKIVYITLFQTKQKS